MKLTDVIIMILVAYSIAVTFTFVFAICDSRAQYAENKVIIEQLCDINPDSYWCFKINRKT